MLLASHAREGGFDLMKFYHKKYCNAIPQMIQ